MPVRAVVASLPPLAGAPPSPPTARAAPTAAPAPAAGGPFGGVGGAPVSGADDDVAYFSTLAPAAGARPAAAYAAPPVLRASPFGGAGAGAVDDGSSFFDSSPTGEAGNPLFPPVAPAAGSPARGLPAAGAAARGPPVDFTPRRAAHADETYFQQLQSEAVAPPPPPQFAAPPSPPVAAPAAPDQPAWGAPAAAAAPAAPAWGDASAAAPWDQAAVPLPPVPSQPLPLQMQMARTASWVTEHTSDADFFERIDGAGDPEGSAACTDDAFEGSPQSAAAGHASEGAGPGGSGHDAAFFDRPADEAAGDAPPQAHAAWQGYAGVAAPALGGDGTEFFEQLGSPAAAAHHGHQPLSTLTECAAAAEMPSPVPQQAAQQWAAAQASPYEQQQAYAQSYEEPAPPAAAPAEAPPLPEGWVSGYSPEGYVYYYDTRTGQSSWEHPGGAAVAQPEAPAVTSTEVQQASGYTYESDYARQTATQQPAQEAHGAAAWAQPAPAYGAYAAAGAYPEQGGDAYAGAYAQPQATAYAQPAAYAQPQAAAPTFFVPQPAAQAGAYAQPQPAVFMPGHGGAAATHAQPHAQYSAAVAAPAPGAAAHDESRSPHGRGPCPCVAFGCGGMVVTVLPGSRAYGGLSGSTGPVRITTLSALLRAGGPGSPGCDYAASLEDFQGPVGGSGGGAGAVMAGIGLSRGSSLADLVRCADERVARAPDASSEALLWGYLRVMCAHRGVITEGPGAADLAALLSPDAAAGTRAAVPAVRLSAPDPAAAPEVERLLLAGRRGDAIAAALAGGLWAPALLLARGAGERALADAAAACIRATVAPGSPLHTSLCMAAGAAADVGAAGDPSAGGAFLAAWRDNLGALAFCRAPGDGAAMVSLGDRLWGERGDAAGAQLCYLLAGVPPLPYSPGSRLCLAGADHRAAPRTYARPEAVQRTELLEAALRCANPQSTLPALQPYRLLQAAALAELGHCREALAYVDAAARAVRASGAAAAAELNAPVFAAVAAGLEERLRACTAARGARLAGAAATKLLGSLSSLLDKGITTIFGDDAAPNAQRAASPAPGSAHASPLLRAATSSAHRRTGSDVSVQSSLELDAGGPAPSAPAAAPSTRPPSRAASPGADDSDARSVGSASGSGMVRSLSSFFTGALRGKKATEAKLGEQNKFYYDEKLKMWVEEGVKPPPPMEAAPPPPTAMPPAVGAPQPGGMAFSARALGGGVRARYVDTFNASPAPGSPGAADAAQPPLPPGADVLGLPPRPKAAQGAPRPQFFVPAAVPQQQEAPPGDAYAQQQDYGAAQQAMPWGGDAPAVLAAQVDAGPPPQVGYGDMMQAPPPPMQYAQPQAQWAGQAPPQQQQQHAGDVQVQQWGELEL